MQVVTAIVWTLYNALSTCQTAADGLRSTVTFRIYELVAVRQQIRRQSAIVCLVKAPTSVESHPTVKGLPSRPSPYAPTYHNRRWLRLAAGDPEV